MPVAADASEARFLAYTAPTPNGYKVTVALEELELPYQARIVDLLSGEQRNPEFVALNPNGKIPVLVDRVAQFTIFESGAILIWLAELTGQLLPSALKQRSEALQWLMFQMGGIGPMMGQANVFHRYFPERIEPVVQRYQRESKRLLGVLDARLKDRQYLLDWGFSIADIANWTWARGHEWSGVPIDDLPNLQRWLAEIEVRPGCARGVQVPFDAVAARRAQGAAFAAAGQSLVSETRGSA